MSAEFDFLDDSEFVQVVCDDPADANCKSGWQGGDFDQWVDDGQSLWHQDDDVEEGF